MKHRWTRRVDIELDAATDMGYIKFVSGAAGITSMEVRDKQTGTLAFVLDVDAEGRLAGIECYEAGRQLPPMKRRYRRAER